jgi:peptidoglycan hydrolase CwlO-like protein
MNRSRSLVILLLLLFLLTAAGGIYFFAQNTSLSQTNKALQVERDSLIDLKYDLLESIDTLQVAIAQASTDNESLKGALSSMQKDLAAREDEIKKLKRQTADLSTLRKEVVQLREYKAQMEGMMNQLAAENQNLRDENDRLSQQLMAVESANMELASRSADLVAKKQEIQDEMERMQVQGVRATGFRIDVLDRSDNPTARANRVRAINVSFDLIDVPEGFRGMQTVYLVLSNANGIPLKSNNPIRTRIDAGGTVTEIEAQVAREIYISRTQRLSLPFEIVDKINSGAYRATVYTGKGWLGSASFQLQ